MQFTFKEKIRKESTYKDYSLLLEGIGFILTSILAWNITPYIWNFIESSNDSHHILDISDIFSFLVIPLIFFSLIGILNVLIIYQYYVYLEIYYFIMKKKSPWSGGTHFVQVNYYDSGKNLIFPKSRPYPHDIGKLEINKDLKFEGLDSSFVLSTEEVLNVREFAFGRYQYMFKEQMTFIDLPFNSYQVSFIAISSIKNPIYWIAKENNKKLLDLIGNLKS
jgi:hypothetical protein